MEDLFGTLEKIEMRRAERKLGIVSKIPHLNYDSSFSGSNIKDSYIGTTKKDNEIPIKTKSIKTSVL